jgi:RNA polymerase sigma factor (sigma-70 family)
MASLPRSPAGAGIAAAGALSHYLGVVRLGRESHADELTGVYRDNVEAVYAFFAYSLSPAVAEDLTSSTFERVVRAWSRYDPDRGSVRTWILAVARNIQTDHYRRQKHRNAVSVDEHPALLDLLVDEDDPLDRAARGDTLRALIAELGEREREIVALRYGADLAAADVARLTGQSEANVHQITSRSLRRLRAALERGPLSDSAALGGEPSASDT